MYNFDYTGEILDVNPWGGPRRFTLNLGNFFPATVKDIKTVVDIICDYDIDPDEKEEHVMTMIRWLEGQIADLKDQAVDMVDKGMVNEKKLKKLVRQKDRYEKNIMRLKAAARKHGLDVEG